MQQTRNRFDILILLLSVLLLIIPYFVTVRDGKYLTLKGQSEIKLPATCMTRQLLGINCPACGMSRSIIEWMHGHFSAAWDYHRLSLIILLLILLQIPYRSYILVAGRRMEFFSNPKYIACFSYFMIFIFFVNWIYNLLNGYHTP